MVIEIAIIWFCELRWYLFNEYVILPHERMILEIIGHHVTLQFLVHTCAILKIWNFTFLGFLAAILCVLIKPSINILFQLTFTIFQCKITSPYARFSFKNEILILLSIDFNNFAQKRFLDTLFDNVWRCFLEHSKGSVFEKFFFMQKNMLLLHSPVSNVFKHVTSCFAYMISNMFVSVCSCLFFSKK